MKESGRTGDSVCAFVTDFIARSFSNRIATPRTNACPERDAVATNETERHAATNGCKFSRCEGHYSFNSTHSAASRITACPGRS